MERGCTSELQPSELGVDDELRAHLSALVRNTQLSYNELCKSTPFVPVMILVMIGERIGAIRSPENGNVQPPVPQLLSVSPEKTTEKMRNIQNKPG